MASSTPLTSANLVFVSGVGFGAPSPPMIPREMPPRSSASAPTPLKMMNAVPSVRSVRHNWALNVGSSCWV